MFTSSTHNHLTLYSECTDAIVSVSVHGFSKSRPELLNNNDTINHQSPRFLATGTRFVEDNFPTEGGGGFRMIQVQYLHHAASDLIGDGASPWPGGWGLLL